VQRAHRSRQEGAGLVAARHHDVVRAHVAAVGAHPEWPCCQFALGYGGNGITFSALAAGIVRDAILGRANPHADLFRFDR
jgi:glycine/D-amino acid oxidase-like deaminating enzyme